MAERSVVKIVNQKDMCCSNCVFGHEIVAGTLGGNIEDDGTETIWALMKTIPVGQTRNCFSRFQRMMGVAGEKFIYPKEDDTCINPKKFEPKEVLI